MERSIISLIGAALLAGATTFGAERPAWAQPEPSALAQPEPYAWAQQVPYAWAQQVPEYADIIAMSSDGSGCPDGVPGVYFSATRKYLTILMPDDFKVAVGPDQPASTPHAFCVVSILPDIPPGWTFAITRAFYHGYAHLSPGAVAQVSMSNWLQGDFMQSGEVSATLPGPFSGTFFRHQPMSQLVFYPCDEEDDEWARYLSIDISLTVSNSSSPSASGAMRAGPGTFSYALYWKHC